jgi:predicted ATPase
MQKHLTQTPEPPRKLNPAIPAHLEVITLKLLAKRPDDRYQSAAEVLRAIEAYRESARAQELTEQEGREQWLPRMVGRNGALSKVREAVTALVKGVGGVLWVEGPEGSGRSRLVEAGLAVAQSQGITVYTGRCLQGGQDWGEGFRAVLESIEAECARTHETFEELPRLREFFGQVDRPAPAVGPYPPEGAYEQDLANFFFHCCQKTPRIIWIEDLENADPGTLSGLAILAKRLVRQKVPLLLVGTFQTFQEPPTPLMRRLLSGELAGVTPQHVNLGPLEVRDVGQMLDAMFPRDSRVLPLAQRLIQESGGNPLIIVESLRLLMAQGRMGVRQGGGERRWAMSMSTEEIRDKLQWPRGTRALLLGRLAAYPQSTRTLLRLFAVWGREMRLRTLLRLASASEEAVLRHVERLLADGWLVEDWTSGEEGYLLAHPAYRSVLLSELTAVDQQRLRTFVEMRLGIKKATSAAPGTAPIR